MRLRPSLKVLFTTGYTCNAGVELLPKPYSIDQLAAKIREILGPLKKA